MSVKPNNQTFALLGSENVLRISRLLRFWALVGRREHEDRHAVKEGLIRVKTTFFGLSKNWAPHSHPRDFLFSGPSLGWLAGSWETDYFGTDRIFLSR
eukprot:scaffold52245_cov32-Tisochrysis_lutea.AAC.1